jgi:hypothetical protein
MAVPPTPPALADIVQPSSPVYLRKLDRKADWGSDETPQAERATDAVRLVFDPRTYPYSVYRVQSDEDLRRVIIGMNGGRQSLSAESYFLALYPEDLAAVGIHADHSPRAGITRCRYANFLHHDLSASDDQALALCLHLIKRGRKVVYFSKGRTTLIIAAAEAEGCYAAVEQSPGCRVEICA